jgi:hypothetical protein
MIESIARPDRSAHRVNNPPKGDASPGIERPEEEGIMRDVKADDQVVRWHA